MLSQKIKKLRNELHLSQVDFGKRIGIDPKTISYWENGKNPPSKSNLMTICNEFSLPTDYFAENVINVIGFPEKNISHTPDRIEIGYWEELPANLKKSKVQSVWFDREIIENDWEMNPNCLRIIPMIGDKMTMYWYPIISGNILIIDTEQNYIMGNGVYFATSRNNTRFWIREMQVLLNDDIQIKGYAPSGETVKVFTKEELDKADFRIIGKVIKNVSFRL